MSCDKTLAVEYEYRLLFGRQTSGNSCFSVKSQLMTADVFPQANSLNRVFEDNITLVEQVVFHLYVSSAFKDSIVVEDAEVIVWVSDRLFDDTFGLTDEFVPVMQWQRQFDDTLDLTETVALGFSTGFDEIVVLGDNVALAVHKVFADTVTLTESFANGHNENLTDNMTMSETGSLLNQGYFDHTGNPNGYFADDYFGDKRTW